MDTSNDDLNVGVSFDADTRPILSALAEIKATLKALDQALPKGQIERALAEPIAKAVKSIEGSVNSMREGYRRAQGAMVDEAQKGAKAIETAHTKAAKALLLDTGEVRKATQQAKQELAGHYNNLGLFISDASAKLEAQAKLNNARALLLDTGEVRKATQQAKQELAGHYNSLGLFVSDASAKLAAQTKTNTARALMLDTGEVRKATQQAQRETAGHYNSLGVFISDSAARVESQTKANTARALMLDTGEVRKATQQAQREVAGHYNSLGVFISNAAVAAASRAEAANAALAAVLARSGNLASIPDSFRLLQSTGTTSTGLWQAGLAKEADGIRQEMARFYTQLEADAKRLDAAWKRIGSGDAVSESFRSLQGAVSKGAGGVTAALERETDEIAAAQRRMYAELERVGNLKDAIRSRLATGDVGFNRAGSSRMTLDQRDAQYGEAMQAMREFYREQELAEQAAHKSQVDKVNQLYKLREDREKSLNALRDQDAAFNSMSARGQLRRAERVNLAMGAGMSEAAAVERYGAAATLAAGNVAALRKAVEDSDKTLFRSTKIMNDAHSAARGLASGFGAMWLTWGNIAPLLAGASISFGLVEAVKAGTKFESVLTTIGALGSTAAAEVQLLGKAALDLGAASQYGPIQVAEGLKTMILAGESAQDAISGIGAALQFATVSELPLEQATEYLLAITKAFGYTTGEMNKVSDVVAKVAAETMSSVTDMANAFKVSSTVAQQFGATLEDQSVALGILSQIGIKGREAGTAVRNMYTELLGSSKEARRILKDTLKLDLFDGDQIKPLKTIMVDITKVIDEFDKKGQLSILDRVFNERGMKAASAYLKSLEAEAARTGVSVSELASKVGKLEEALQNASGFSAVASASMSATTENIMKSVVSSLEAALIQAYDALSPYLVKISLALRDAFRSPEFVDGISSMVRTVGDLGKFLYEHLDVVKAVAVGYVTYKVATVALTPALALLNNGLKVATPLLTQTAGILTASGAAGGVAATGFTAAGAAAGTLGAATRALLVAMGPISIGLTLLASAYVLFADNVESSASRAIKAEEERARRSKEASEADRMRLDVSIEAMDKEIERIEAFLRHGGDEKKAQEDIAQAAIDSTRSRILAEAQVQAQLKESAAATLELAAADELRISKGSGGLNEYVTQLRAQAAALRKEAADALSGAQTQLDRYNASVARLRALRAEEDKARAAKRPPGVPPGGRTFGDEVDKKRRQGVAALKTDLGNELSLIEKRYADEVSTVQQAEQNKKRLLEAQHQNKLISDGEFHSRELQLAQEAEAARTALIGAYGLERALKQKELEGKLLEQYEDHLDEIDSKLSGGDATKARQQALEVYQGALKKLSDEAATFNQRLNNDGKSIEDNALTRMTLQAYKAAGAVRDVQLKLEDFQRSQKAGKEDADRAEALNDALRNATEGQAEYLRAAASEQEKFIAQYRDYDKAIEEAEKSLNGYVAALGDEVELSYEQSKALGQYIELLEKLKKTRAEIQGGEAAAVSEAGMRALRSYQKDEIKRLSGDTAEALITGLRKGSKEGGKQLRKIIEAELRKPIVMAVQALVQPVVGALMGSLGFGGGAGGVAGSALSSIGSSIGGSMIGNTVMSGIGSIGGVVGTAYNTALGTSLGLGSSSAAAAAKAASMAGGTSATSASLGSTLGAAAPYLGAAAAIYMIAKSLDDSGTYHTGGAAQYKGGALRTSLGFRDNEEGLPSYNPKDNIDNQFGTGFGYVERGDQTISAVSTLAQSLGTALDGVAVAFGQKAGYEIATAFADDSSKDGAWGALRISKEGQELLNWQNTRTSRWAPKEFGDGEGGYKEYLAAVAKDTRQVLLDMDLPGWADTVLNAIGDSPSIDSLSAALTQIGQAQAVFKSFGQYMTTFATLADSSVTKLAAASGGIGALAGNMGVFVDQFYTNAEKLAVNTANVREALAKLGFEMPATRDEFKALVQSQIALGDAGAETAAGLLAVSGAVSAVLPPFEDAAAGVADAMRNLRTSLIELEAGFAGGGLSRQYRAEDAAQEISGLFSGIGIQKDVGMLTQKILNATGGEVEQFFRDLMPALKTDEARQKLVDVTRELLDLANGAGSVADAYQKQQEALRTLAQDAARLLSARNSAGQLADRIGQAMGSVGTFGVRREAELWGALNSTLDFERQIELSGQLTDMVMARHQLEVQNGQKLLDFGRGLRDYVADLKLSDMSPLTNSQKLAEAAAQFNATLAGAEKGDTNAQSQLQGAASAYLDIAQTYFAGNSQYEAIFENVTTSLDLLGANSMSQGQKQMDMSVRTLSELQQLQNVAQLAYAALDSQYEESLKELEAAQTALVLQSDSLDQLKGIVALLAELPAEIAARLPPVNTDVVTADMLPAIMSQQPQPDNSELIAELQALRAEVAQLRAENRQDAQMVAGATVASASASAAQIADATAKAAYATTVKQGATII